MKSAQAGTERLRRSDTVIAGVGIDTDEAVRIVQAALTNGIAASPSS
ncbi:hypothetical protein [Streptomyces sp. NPDC059788]